MRFVQREVVNVVHEGAGPAKVTRLVLQKRLRLLFLHFFMTVSRRWTAFDTHFPRLYEIGIRHILRVVEEATVLQ